MTPQELEALIAASSSPIPTRANWGAVKVEHKLVELLPALLDLWRAAEEAEQADRVVKMARYATPADFAPLLKRLQDARDARRAALDRLREVQP